MKIMRAFVVAMAAVLTVSLGVPTAQAATWSSSDRWGTWSNGGYTVRNNIWGNGYGPQTVWANSYSNWGVWANHPNTGGIKSYPHSEKMVNRRLSSIGSLSSSFNVSYPNSGAYTTAYDIWANNNAYEIMLWMNKVGPVGPIGSWQASASVGGPGPPTSPASAAARLVAGGGLGGRPQLERLQGFQRAQRGVLVRPHVQHRVRHRGHQGGDELDPQPRLVR